MTQNGPYQKSVPELIEKIAVHGGNPVVIAWVGTDTCGEFVAQAGPYIARAATVGEVVRGLARQREADDEEGSRGMSIPLTDEARKRIAVERFVRGLRGMNPDDKLSATLDRLEVEYGLKEPAPESESLDDIEYRTTKLSTGWIVTLIVVGGLLVTVAVTGLATLAGWATW